MLFNSYEFIFFFLPITFFIFFYLNSKKLTQVSKGFLVFSSLFFYSWWNIIYLSLIVISMMFNYIMGISLIDYDEYRKKVSKKQLLSIGIVVNVGLLGYFKYADFFINNINCVFNIDIPLLHLALPLAISFFSFQQIAYLVESYRGETKEYEFLDYAFFVTFFPQLIAGPIVHYKEMISQFTNEKNKLINYKNIAIGLFIFSIGLFKKVVIADRFAVWATKGFDYAEVLNFCEAWVTSLSYTFQLYFDFSGYTDMATGAALLFNISLPINFNSPYKASNIQNFWRRWHITLSRFLKNCIYNPLGGNRKGNLKTYNNLMITFLIGGFWHGAGWNFIFWGFLHGLALVVHRIWNQLGFKLNNAIGWIITFNFINIAWIFFRATNWDDAIKVLHGMLGLNGIVLPSKLALKLAFLNQYGIEFGIWGRNINGNQWTFAWLFAGFFLITFFKNSIELKNNFDLNCVYLAMNIFLIVTSFFYFGKYTEFLYFNF